MVISVKAIIRCTATIPAGLENQWLHHLRDFDTAHPGCHFEVIADAPGLTVKEAAEALRIQPKLPVRKVIKRKQDKGQPKRREKPNEQQAQPGSNGGTPKLRMDTRDAAAYIGVSKSQLEKLRVAGGGPRYIKLRWQVFYDLTDLDRWLEDNKRISTADTPETRNFRR